MALDFDVNLEKLARKVKQESVRIGFKRGE